MSLDSILEAGADALDAGEATAALIDTAAS